MTEVNSIESGNAVVIPSRLYRVVRVPIEFQHNWKPTGNKSIPPIICKGLTLSLAVDAVIQRNQRVKAEKRHKWFVVVLADSSTHEFAWGVAVVFIEPEDYPESLTGVPVCRLAGGEHGEVPEPQTKKSLMNLLTGQNRRIACAAWLPRCWHLLTPVV